MDHADANIFRGVIEGIMATNEPSPPTVRQLRRRWKPHKEHLLASQSDHPTPIRFHRACSWLARVEQLDDDADYDFALLCQWTAFNALYGQWDSKAREPKPNRASWRAFLDKILVLDSDGHVSGTLTENKRLVMSLLEDEYLSSFFWQDPSDKRASQSKKAKYDARTWYIEKRWTMILVVRHDHAVRVTPQDCSGEQRRDIDAANLAGRTATAKTGYRRLHRARSVYTDDNRTRQLRHVTAGDLGRFV